MNNLLPALAAACFRAARRILHCESGRAVEPGFMDGCEAVTLAEVTVEREQTTILVRRPFAGLDRCPFCGNKFEPGGASAPTQALPSVVGGAENRECLNWNMKEEKTMRMKDQKTMRNKNQARWLILTLLSVGLAVPALAQPGKPTFAEFDAPGAGKTWSAVCANAFLGFLGCGTTPLANNDLGLVVGVYSDAKVVLHGFLRTPDGRIVSLDAPGAGVEAGQGTAAYAINDLGVIAGTYQDFQNIFHGFLRYPDGSFISLDAPEAGTGAQQGTLATNVNPDGTTAGSYIDANGVNHGFVRSPDNSFAWFDPAGSVFTYPCEETCLAPDGTVVGFFADAGNTAHGFVRSPGGSIVPFDDPAARTAPGAGTAAFSIDIAGATAGAYWDANGVVHGFERGPSGEFANFEAPHAGTGAGQGTRPSTNDSRGIVAGWFIDAKGVNHGFVWHP